MHARVYLLFSIFAVISLFITEEILNKTDTVYEENPKIIGGLRHHRGILPWFLSFHD